MKRFGRDRAPRRDVAIRAHVVPDGDPGAAWRQCTIVNLSLTGAALDLVPPPMLPNRLVVQLELGEGHGVMGVQLKGEIRHVDVHASHVRVGLEFVELTGLEQTVLGGLLASVAA